MDTDDTETCSGGMHDLTRTVAGAGFHLQSKAHILTGRWDSGVGPKRVGAFASVECYFDDSQVEMMAKMTRGQKGVVVAALLVGLAIGLLTPRWQSLSNGALTDSISPGNTAVAVQAPSEARAERGLAFGLHRPSKQSGASDVVLISLDTTRADYLQPYGSSLETSPFLAAFAKQSVTFTHAYSTSSWTSPSMASLMTGLYPSQHGATQVVSRDDHSVAVPVLASEKTTLAEMLSGAGYESFAVNSNMLLCEEVGFAQGFEHVVEQDNAPRPFQRVMVREMSERLAASQKYLLWVHYVDPHWPYRPRAPWFGLWNESSFDTADAFLMDAALWDYREEFKKPANANVELSHLPKFFSRVEKAFINNQIGINGIRALTAGATQKALLQDRLRYLAAAYRSEIRGMDEDVGLLLNELGVDDDALVIVVADHGEEFLDHDSLGHISESLYQELIRVPLMIRFPKGRHAGRVVERPVSVVDVVPTVLSALGLRVPSGVAGIDLDEDLKAHGAGDEHDTRDVVSELTHHTGAQMRSVVHFPWKFIYHFDKKHGELYNLRDDPGEQRDLAQQEAQRATSMLTWLEAWSEAWSDSSDGHAASPVPSFRLPAADTARLRALGYAPE